MVHKLTMTSLLKFLPVDLQMPGGMLVVIAYATVILLTSPYLRKDDDRLHQFAQAELYLIVLAGYTLYSGTVGLDEKTDIILSGALVLVSSCNLGFWLTLSCRVLRTRSGDDHDHGAAADRVRGAGGHQRAPHDQGLLHQEGAAAPTHQEQHGQGGQHVRT